MFGTHGGSASGAKCREVSMRWPDARAGTRVARHTTQKADLRKWICLRFCPPLRMPLAHRSPCSRRAEIVVPEHASRHRTPWAPLLGDAMNAVGAGHRTQPLHLAQRADQRE